MAQRDWACFGVFGCGHIVVGRGEFCMLTDLRALAGLLEAVREAVRLRVREYGLERGVRWPA